MAKSERYDTTEQHSHGISADERQQVLLDDLRVQIARLADAVERQNDLLEQREAEQ